MSRHRGTFKIANPEPYELSRSRIENFIQCPACFYMQQVEGIEFPSFPGFNINEANDILLKKDFDKYRGKKTTHAFLIERGYEYLTPFSHEHFELWTQSLHFGAKNRLHYDHKQTNLRVGGGLDDVWLNLNTNKIHVVDYKKLVVADKKLVAYTNLVVVYKSLLLFTGKVRELICLVVQEMFLWQRGLWAG